MPTEGVPPLWCVRLCVTVFFLTSAVEPYTEGISVGQICFNICFCTRDRTDTLGGSRQRKKVCTPLFTDFLPKYGNVGSFIVKDADSK